MRELARVGAALLLALLCSLPAAAACRLRVRERIVLFGLGADPGVFLWDSRFRLRAYHAASFDEAQGMLPRALLVRAGTRAIVIWCLPRFVQPRYGMTLDDAVEVRILTGPLHGQTGWVLGSDARL